MRGLHRTIFALIFQLYRQVAVEVQRNVSPSQSHVLMQIEGCHRLPLSRWCVVEETK